MKRILGLICQDITLMLRDSIIVYIAFGPLLMALALRLFMPSVEDVRMNFVAENRIGETIISELEKYGNVQRLEDKQEVITRVERTDMVPGIIDDNGKLVLIFEGNETGSLVETSRAILNRVVQGGSSLNLKAESINSNNSFMKEILTVMIIMTSIFLGGVAAGFNMVNEKDVKAIQALSVSPLRMREFITARGIVAFVISVATTMLGSLILSGNQINYLKLMILLASSCMIIALVSLIVGRMANNQISAISAIKLAMPVFLTIPLASLFLPEKLQLLLYPFPNYWQFRALRGIYSSMEFNPDFWLSSAMTFVLGAAFLVWLSGTFKKHFGIR